MRPKIAGCLVFLVTGEKEVIRLGESWEVESTTGDLVIRNGSLNVIARFRAWHGVKILLVAADDGRPR